MRLTMRIGQLVSVVYIAYAIYIVHTPHIMHWTRMVRNKKNSYDTHATKVSLKFVCEAKQNNCYSVIFGSSNMSLFCLYVIYIPFIRVCVCVYWYGTAEWKYRRFDIYYRIIVFFLSMVGWILLFRLNHIIYNINYSIHTKSDKKKKTKTENSYNYTLVVFRMYSSHITHIHIHRTLPTTGMCVQ